MPEIIGSAGRRPARKAPPLGVSRAWPVALPRSAPSERDARGDGASSRTKGLPNEASWLKQREAFVHNAKHFPRLRRWPSPTGILHYKPTVIRKRRPRCLEAQTLAALAHGRIPDELEQVRQHLPQCSKCLGALAAAVQRRTRGEGSPLTARGPLPAPVDSSHGRLFRGLAVALSLLALGSSATCWYLDTPVPGGRPLDPASPSDVARGAITGVE